MVIDAAAGGLDVHAARTAIDGATRADDNVFLDAQGISQALFGDHLPANVIVLGAAWQRGAIPLSLDALHEALRLNGAAVEGNIAAFEWGRACVAAPGAVEQLLHWPRRGRAGRRARASSIASRPRTASCGGCSPCASPT